MLRSLPILLPLLILVTTARAADEALGDKIEYGMYPAYFEKNNSGLKGDASFLAFTDQDAFGKVFALRPPLGGKTSVALPENVFEKQIVVSIIKRGNSVTKYAVEKMTADGEIIYVQYKAEAGPPGTATFASPLILAADQGKARQVVFIENGKKIVSVDVK